MSVQHRFPYIQVGRVILNTRHGLIALGIAGISYLLSKKRVHRPLIRTNSLLCEIERKSDTITLSWQELGGFYRVFRNHQCIYSGMEPRVVDTQRTAGTLYTYTIERMNAQGKVLDTLRIQTSTAVERKKEDNILLDMVLTAIVAKGQISLEWEPIQGVKEYQVYRNGMKIAEVEACSFLDTQIKDDEVYTYAIKSKRPLPRSEQESFAVKSFLASVMGICMKGSSQKRAAMEEISTTVKVGPVEELLKPVKKRQNRSQERAWQLRYSTFLPERWLKNPNVTSKVPYFKGDDRGFDPEASRYRTRADVYIREQKEDAVIELSKAVGKSEAYNQKGEFLEEGVASDEQIVVKHLGATEEKTAFQLNHSVGNPIIVSPAVDYKVNGTFYRNGEINIAGYHDQAPHHEVYLKQEGAASWETLHQAESKGLEMMASPTANHLWRYSTFTH